VPVAATSTRWNVVKWAFGFAPRDITSTRIAICRTRWLRTIRDGLYAARKVPRLRLPQIVTHIGACRFEIRGEILFTEAGVGKRLKMATVSCVKTCRSGVFARVGRGETLSWMYGEEQAVKANNSPNPSCQQSDKEINKDMILGREVSVCAFVELPIASPTTLPYLQGTNPILTSKRRTKWEKKGKHLSRKWFYRPRPVDRCFPVVQVYNLTPIRAGIEAAAPRYRGDAIVGVTIALDLLRRIC